MTTAPVESLLGATIAFLERHPPFDNLERDAMRFLAGRLSLGYHPAGTTILSPDHGEPQNFFIVQRGVVQVPHTYQDSGAVMTLGPGECFSLGALLEGRAVSSPYVAAVDTFCYQLPAADFHDLLRRSPRFQHFATGYLASLLRESRRLLAIHFSTMASDQLAGNRSLRSLIRRPAVTCTPDTPIGDALRTIQREKIGSIVVSSPQGVPLGILTRYDALDRVALPQRDLAQPISSIMTRDPVTLHAEASVYEAAIMMARRGIRHIPVVDGRRLVGIVTERDLFALQRVSMNQINRTITSAQSPEELQQAAQDIRQLARSLLEHGVAAEQLTLIISTLNDVLTRRIIDLEKTRHELEGIDWCWLAFGSEGRYEQTISTDQDNGLIFVDNQHRPATEVRALLIPFAQAVNHALDACGFPLCIGNIMAGNPQWCLSLAEWQDKFEHWVSNTDPQALLNAVIFFDFRPLHGAERLADSLYKKLFALTSGNPRFLRQMAQEALQVRPPFGMLRDFVTDDAGTLDLKKSGTRLFVDAARIFGLATGTAHTSTAHRLREAGAKLNVSDAEIAAIVEAFFFLQLLRLREQIAMPKTTLQQAHNRINPDDLNEVDRRILKECLRQARRLQTRLALDYQL